MGDFLSDNPLVLLIGACEVGFWVLLAAGLAARYLLRAHRLSTVLLLLVPVLDVVLVSASLVDVAGGSPPGLTHGLAAVYLGGTVAFGHSMIRWADARFAHRFAAGPTPPRPPRYGAAKVAYEWREWSKAALAWGIAFGVMLLTATVAGTGVPQPLDWSADPMWGWGSRITVGLLIWFVGWPLWTTLAPPRAPETTDVNG
ncbi:hypothetical protein [Pseudonocardia alaniniphila]|uniref:Integral membrane protein n=1 Tax=Pseudonocardia alaniniphila TaxID=75291 RepID=A0ABS9TLX5_9PSEU|nr:hypothetical protein [Pseudonocardia alaniniphila]MCH6169545.1 hypothetical protein [Pseudonocardia alaniniphila]